MTDAADSLWILDLGLEIYDLPGVRLRVGCWTCVDFGFAPPRFRVSVSTEAPWMRNSDERCGGFRGVRVDCRS
jgi:hypothetical protein